MLEDSCLGSAKPTGDGAIGVAGFPGEPEDALFEGAYALVTILVTFFWGHRARLGVKGLYLSFRPTSQLRQERSIYRQKSRTVRQVFS